MTTIVVAPPVSPFVGVFVEMRVITVVSGVDVVPAVVLGMSKLDELGGAVELEVGGSVVGGADVDEGTGDGVGVSPGGSVAVSVGVGVGVSLGESVGGSVGTSVGAAVGGSVGGSVGESVGGPVGESVGGSVGGSVDVLVVGFPAASAFPIFGATFAGKFPAWCSVQGPIARYKCRHGKS